MVELPLLTNIELVAFLLLLKRRGMIHIFDICILFEYINMKDTKMTKAFTMIELIFVIVIIGILAAVAIPKLSATRDDAKLTQAISNARACLSDAGAAYTAKIIDLSVAADFTSPACTAAQANSLVTATLGTNSVTISEATPGSAPASLVTTHVFGGSVVSY